MRIESAYIRDDYHIIILQYSFQVYHKDTLLLDEWVGPNTSINRIKEIAEAYIDGKDKDWYELGVEAYKNQQSANPGNVPSEFLYRYQCGYARAKESHIAPHRERFMEKLRKFLELENSAIEDNEYEAPTLFLTVDNWVVDAGPLRMSQ